MEQSNYNPRLDAAIKFVRNNPGSMPSMSEMANLCGLSSSYFSRLFHREMGMNFVTWLKHIRIEQACRRLEEDAMVSIQQLAEELGFSESSYFIRIFHRITGETPYAYRKKHFKRDM